MLKKKIKFLFKILFTLFLIWFVFSKIDIEEFAEIIKEANLFWLFLAFIFFNISKIISSIRLNLYFKDLKLNISEKDNLYLYYVGMFYNLFLPGGIGGDGYKIYLLNKRYKIKVAKLVTATILDRISGLVALSFLGGVLFTMSSFISLNNLFIYFTLLFLILLYPIYLYFHKKLFKLFLNSLKETTILAIIVQLFQILSALSIIFSINSPFIIDFLTLFLLSSVIASFPLTIGGVGAREFTFLYGFNLINRDVNLGVAFSLIFFIITALSSLIGIFLEKRINFDKKG